jgi:hypothetical protein
MTIGIDYSKEAVQGRRCRGRPENQNKAITYVGEDVENPKQIFEEVVLYAHGDT